MKTPSSSVAVVRGRLTRSVTPSAVPTPVTPKISAPTNAIPASSAASSTDDQIARRAAVHRPQARHIARERQTEARLEALGAPAQRGPFDARRASLQREHQEVRVVERR